MSGNESSGSEPTPEELLEKLKESGGDELVWWLREFKKGYEDGKPLTEVAAGLYFKVEEAPTDISLLLATAVIFGVVWEKNDDTENASRGSNHE